MITSMLFLVVCLFAQTDKPEVVPLSPSGNNMIVGKQQCGHTLMMGSTTKKFSEIFPAECPIPVGAAPIFADVPTEARISDLHAIDDLGRHCYAEDQHPAGFDAVDEPAIQETHEEEYGTADWCNSCNHSGVCTSMGCDPHAKHKVTVHTCFDKSRILLTAQDGTHWCHRVTR